MSNYGITITLFIRKYSTNINYPTPTHILKHFKALPLNNLVTFILFSQNNKTSNFDQSLLPHELFWHPLVYIQTWKPTYKNNVNTQTRCKITFTLNVPETYKLFPRFHRKSPE